MSDKAFFVGDHAALDFLNTIAAPRGEAIEFLPDGEAYVTWLSDAGLIDPDQAPAMLDAFGRPALDRVAREARDLREWFRQLIAKPVTTQAHRPATKIAAEAITTLNQILALDSIHRQLEASAQRMVLRQKRELTKARQLLVPIAEAIAELLTDGDQTLVKRCANPSCTLWFYDRTKAHRRLFCSATVCGNRAKVAAFRERQRQAK